MNNRINLLDRARACESGIPDDIMWQLVEAAFWVGRDAVLGDDTDGYFIVSGEHISALDDAFERLSDYVMAGEAAEAKP